MTIERRIKDRRVSPAVAEFALSERGELLARIAELIDERDSQQLVVGAYIDQAQQLRDELAALKARPSAGVVLPYWEPCNPGCDPEFNGQRSKECAQLCHQARAALNAGRAQSVPDGWKKGFKLHEIDKALDGGLPRPNYWAETCDGEPAVHTKLWRGLPGSASFYDSRFWPLYGADMLYTAPPATGVIVSGEHVPDAVFQGEFQVWWEEHGQFCRAGGGSYERTFAFQAWRHLYPELMRVRADFVDFLALLSANVHENGPRSLATIIDAKLEELKNG